MRETTKTSCIVVNAPNECQLNNSDNKAKIFLGGTIDNGNSENWQEKVCEELKNLNIVIYNPRRNPWPKDAGDDVVNEQINWELERLDLADLVIINILPDSKSPISLMELGLYANSKKLIVFCGKDFYRYNNVKNVCERYNVLLYNNNSVEFIANKIKQSLIVMRSRMTYSKWEL